MRTRQVNRKSVLSRAGRLVTVALVLMACTALAAPILEAKGKKGGKSFQIAFVSRVATDSGGQLLGTAESLQAEFPGVTLGDFEENVGAFCNDPIEPPACPVEGGCVPICDTVFTPRGSITYQAFVLVAPITESGPFLTSAVSGEIVGGTGAFATATGTVTLAGSISLCVLGTEFCAEADSLPPELGLGLRFDCNFILRGVKD